MSSNDLYSLYITLPFLSNSRKTCYKASLAKNKKINVPSKVRDQSLYFLRVSFHRKHHERARIILIIRFRFSECARSSCVKETACICMPWLVRASHKSNRIARKIGKRLNLERRNVSCVQFIEFDKIKT